MYVLEKTCRAEVFIYCLLFTNNSEKLDIYWLEESLRVASSYACCKCSDRWTMLLRIEAVISTGTGTGTGTGTS